MQQYNDVVSPSPSGSGLPNTTLALKAETRCTDQRWPSPTPQRCFSVFFTLPANIFRSASIPLSRIICGGGRGKPEDESSGSEFKPEWGYQDCVIRALLRSIIGIIFLDSHWGFKSSTFQPSRDWDIGILSILQASYCIQIHRGFEPTKR